MATGGRTRELADALVRYLDASGYGDLRPSARDMARDIARAYDLDSGDARFLALAECRDKARTLRFSLRMARKEAVKADGHARADLDFVSDASPWIGQERLSQAQLEARGTQRRYAHFATAGAHVRGIIRSLNRDLAHETAAARAQHATRATAISRRLVELALRASITPPSQRRREYWSGLDELAREAHPSRAQLRYAVRTLLRELRSLA